MTATVPPPRPESARVPEAKVASMFVDRWSRRALSPRPLGSDTVRSLLEAARWAPSSGNSQPWLFVYADDEATLAAARPVLNDSNRRWADKAPLLLFVFARRADAKGRPLPTGQFDSGSAWMSLALQAHALGLTAHGMAGFHHDLSYEVFGVPVDEYEAMAAIAVAYPGDADELPDDLKAREKPNSRKSVTEFAFRGRFRAG
jgi:nitroreductase